MIAVLDYGIGNLRSAEKALQFVGGDAHLVADPADAAEADGVVLAGVGGFGSCMQALRRSALDAVAVDAIEAGRPFLGICVGLQMLFDGSEEDPGHRGLGILAGTVRRLPDGVKRPQMQWNVVTPAAAGAAMMAGLPDPAWVYFVHSYAPPAGDYVAATCDYGGTMVAAVARDNVWGTQFHPEKSSAAGLALLTNFVRRCTAAI